MRWTDLFVRRPVVSLVVNLLILIAGLQAVSTLRVRQYPELESATVTVTTPYVGASADLVRGFITVPLERAIAAAEGIDYLQSQSQLGLSTIQVRLKLNYDASQALADISTRVDQVRGELPPEAEVPSIIVEPSDAQFAAMYLSFASDVLRDNQVTDYLTRVVQPRLSAVPGVQRADILGARTFALRAWLKPDKMAALGVSPAQVRGALEANNFLSSVGETKGLLASVELGTNTDLRTVEEFEQLVVREEGGALVRLGDVAEVVFGAESYDQDVRLSGKSAVFMGVWVRPDANSLDVIESVRRDLRALQRELPSGMDARVAFDSTTYIDSAIRDVVKTLAETVLIVIAVIFLFLGSLRTVLVPVVAIPLSLIGAVFLMQVLGFTLNLLTLLAIVLSVGLVVDDAIVVVENVERHVREGKRPFEAALIGARELVAPILAMTITLAAVYAPIGFQGGLTGALFREFAFTLAGAVLISGVVALTLSPMMSSRLIRQGGPQGRVTRLSNRAFVALQQAYGRALRVTLNARPAVYAVWLVLSVLVVPMFLLSPRELAPEEDQGVVFSALELPPNATLERLTPYTEQIYRSYASFPEFSHSFQITTPERAFGGMVVVPWAERERSIFPIQEQLASQLAEVAGVRAPSFLPPALPSPGLFPVELVIGATAPHEQILGFAQQLVGAARQSGEFAFPPTLDVKIDRAKTEIVLDRDRLGAMGQSMRDVGRDLSAMVAGNYVNRFNYQGRSYKVIPQIERAARLAPAQLVDIHIAGPEDRLIPLAAVARLEDRVVPRTLNRFQQLNSVTVSGVPARSLEGALRVLENKAEEILPPGYRVGYTGESRQLRQEEGKFVPAMGLSLLLIFLVLAAQFNSFRDPFVILAGSVPLAMFGAMIFTFLHFAGPPGMRFAFTEGWTTTLNIYSQVGLVTLVGLVAKNGILLVEFANQAQAQGAGKLEAIRDAAHTRFRPILMTTIATVVGHFPLTLVTGPGASARNAIGVVLVGGMTIGTLFTLLVVPAVYMLVAKDLAASRAHPEPGEP